jgi:hypothetical protein
MKNLVLPNRVAIQLVDTDKRPLKMADILFRVRFLRDIRVILCFNLL